MHLFLALISCNGPRRLFQVLDLESETYRVWPWILDHAFLDHVSAGHHEYHSTRLVRDAGWAFHLAAILLAL